MELDKFISETLLEISRGISGANDQRIAESGKQDTPRTFFLRPGSQSERGAGIEFDVAVTSKVTGGGSGGAKVKLAVVDAELGGKGGVSNEQVSRIKFTINVGQWGWLARGLTGCIWTPLQQGADRCGWLEGAPAVVYPAS